MNRAPTRVLDQGRVTIPADIRADLDLQKGDYVVIEIEPLDQGDRDG